MNQIHNTLLFKLVEGLDYIKNLGSLSLKRKRINRIILVSNMLNQNAFCYLLQNGVNVYPVEIKKIEKKIKI